jgi:hypothetical protein
MAAVTDTLRAWVGLGPTFLVTADPVTGAVSGTFAFDIPDAAAAPSTPTNCPGWTS